MSGEGIGTMRKGAAYYLELAEKYRDKNADQTYLCYENACFHAESEAEQEQIRKMMQGLRQTQSLKVHKTAIVILSYNASAYMKQCVQSIQENNAPESYELIVVDNASTDGVQDWLREQAQVLGNMKLQCNEQNTGFPVGCNQGIRMAEEQADILLLNNDTIVTEDAIFWLRMGLYEDDEVGAVGSVSDPFLKKQTKMERDYSYEACMAIGRENNRYLEHPYEMRIQLVGYAMLIRRQALEQVGYLDESFGRGNFEDNDLVMRLWRGKYRCMLCYNSFIYHYVSANFKKNMEEYNDLIDHNYRIYEQKCGFHIDYYYKERYDLLEYVTADEKTPIRVLDLGCGCGTTLARVRGMYSRSQVFGIEKNQKAAEIGTMLCNVMCGNLDNCSDADLRDGKAWNHLLPWKADYILMGDVIPQLLDPVQTMKVVRDCLAPGGKVIASIHNLQYQEEIQQLLMGNFQRVEGLNCLRDKENLHFYTAESILELFAASGIQVEDIRIQEVVNQQESNQQKSNQEMEQIKQLPWTSDAALFEAAKYIVIGHA